MRVGTLAVALVLAALVASGCGGDDEAPAAVATTQTTGTAHQRETRSRADDGETHERETRTDPDAGGGDRIDEEESEPATRERAERAHARRPNSRVELKRFLDRAKHTVRAAVDLISAADPSVCRRYFTERYAERQSGLRGAAAFDKCERDIARNEGNLDLTAFGPSRIRDGRASVKFNLKVQGRLTSQEWRLVFRDGRWLVDASAGTATR